MIFVLKAKLNFKLDTTIALLTAATVLSRLRSRIFFPQPKPNSAKIVCAGLRQNLNAP
jgi:hypothetical protein